MTSVAPPDTSLTVADVARRLGVDPKTIYRLIGTGRLPAVKVGRAWRIAHEAVVRYEQTSAGSATERGGDQKAEDGAPRRTARANGSVTKRAARAEAVSTLAVSPEEFGAILASVADGIIVRGPRGETRFANETAALLFGFPSAEALVSAPSGKMLSHCRVTDEDGAQVTAEQLPGITARHTGEQVNAVLRLDVVGSAEARWLHVRAVPVRDAGGNVRFTVTAFQDITELRRAAIVEQRLAAIVTSSTDAIASKTLDGIVTSWNASAERMFGYTAAEMVGRSIRRLIPPDRQDEEDRILARLRAGERIEHFETVRVTKDGRLLDVSLTISPVKDATGTIVGASKIVRDITAQKLAEAEREQLLAREQAALAAAQEALAVRDEFLSAISHDLRTPLTSIRGLAQLFARQLGRLEIPQRERLLEQADAMFRAAGTMVAMVEELLDLTRLEAGRSPELRREQVDLVALAQVVAREYGRTASRHDIQVHAAAPTLVGSWDRVRLERVLSNLLSNAVKYSPNGGPVQVSIRPVDEHTGAWAEVSVSDQGMGIPAADLPYVFERFRRGTNVAGKVGGVGIGLAGVQRIVELHGGTIAVTSTEGVGTTVTVRLPLVESPVEPAS